MGSKATPNCSAGLPDDLANRGVAKEKIIGNTPKSVSVRNKPVKLLHGRTNLKMKTPKFPVTRPMTRNFKLTAVLSQACFLLRLPPSSGCPAFV